MSDSRNHDQLEAVCQAIEEELEKLAVDRCNGTITEEAFIAKVLEIEAKEVTPHELTLTASDTSGGWMVFALKMNGTNETCASFEFLPETGELRRGDCNCETR